ncbi:hypothetical protein Pmani_028512 [Petrolisthes manimaculis]|uniref:THAP-type domain-containing protein n=1 Tax=Petrolisthes manimaculis TaxID=1843537 RepID=A0AAE1TXY9_9EUCA|nr:hypothetical protein Pmani_028512 [Petrolisthes manimaculis]
MSTTEKSVANADEQVTKGTKRAAEEETEDAKKLKGEENGEEELEEEEDLEGEEEEDLGDGEEELDEEAEEEEGEGEEGEGEEDEEEEDAEDAQCESSVKVSGMTVDSPLAPPPRPHGAQASVLRPSINGDAHAHLPPTRRRACTPARGRPDGWWDLAPDRQQEELGRGDRKKQRANAAPPQTDNTATTAAHQQCRIYLHQNTTKSPTTTMPRQRPRTSNKQMDRTDLEKAFNHRVQTECSHKEAAEKFGVKKTTLVDAFNRSKKEANGVTYVPVPGKVNMVFTPEQEGLIVKYTIQAAQMFYGLPRIEVRRMVYNYAHACKSKSIPEAWERKRMATTDWYYSFMERHPDLVLKAPEGMSIARIVAFNKVNVETFFKAYTLALEKYQFTPDRIFNLDESSLSTVMKPCKVVCARGKPVATQVTRERGETMTFVGIISAAGQAVPPVFIIPRARWNPTFMRNTSFGSKGILHPSGWMNGDCFVQTLQHLHERSGSSDENKILLIMDNAECHMNINVVEFAIRHGIVIVTLPPHTTDKLQPLDVSVFGPFKTFLRALLNDHALMHPNEHITVHQLPEFACDAWTKAANPANILSGYRATGIWPVNRLIFPDEAFVGAQVTERPAPPEDFVVEVGPPSSDGANSSDGEDQPPASQVIDLPDLSPTLEDDPDDPTGTAWPDPGTAAPGPNTATPGPNTATPGPNTATPGPSTATPGPSTATPGPSSLEPSLSVSLLGRWLVHTSVIMPSSCSVFCCKNDKRKNAGSGIRYFGFPRNKEVQQEWIRACDRPDDINVANAIVCSKHFKEVDYRMKYQLLGKDNTRYHKLLKKDAVPSLLLSPGLSERGVRNWVNRFYDSGGVEMPTYKYRPGKKKITPPRDIEIIRKEIVNNPTITSQQIKDKHGEAFKDVSLRTITRRIQELGHRRIRTVKERELTQQQIMKRLAFANNYGLWGKDQWNIPLETLGNLSTSLPMRLKAVCRNKGRMTQYQNMSVGM